MLTQTWTFVLLFLVPVFSFPPQTVPSEPHTRTHREITIEGLFRGVAKVLQSNLLVNTSHKDPKQIVKDYFGSDAGGFQNFYNVLLTIIDHENMVQRYRQEEAYVHVNGEQIYRAHMYLCNIRLRIKTIVQTHPIDRDFLLLSIGQYLYTLQEFYSNTNWIEMKGVAINKNLGIVPNFGYEVSALTEDTCKNCEEGNCRNNDVSDGKLTSGYKSGQNIEKPAKPSDYQSGKCSHGGLGDKSSEIPAKGGINKERFNVKFSPHYYLHPHASEAAVMATDFFISADKTGLVHLTELDVFLQIFQLRRRMKIKREGYTIAFAIDTTGSMSDDIKAVIANSVNIVTSLQGSNNEPDNYVLTTFNDPVKVGLRYVTSDGYQMIRQLQGLRANGGGDCPEYALSGTLTAIQLSLPGSTVYVFTDADAKDYSLADLVIKEAKKRDISIIFLLTGTCGRIMRRGTKRHRRGSGSDDMFKHIAQNTGGSVHETTKENIGEVMETVMEKTLPSADVIIELKTLRSRNNATVVIDSDPNVVKIAMEGISKNLMNNVQLWNTNGTKLSFSGDVKFMYMATMKLNIITLKNPTPGRYNLRLEDTEDFVIHVNITAQSELFFSSHVMEMADGLLTTMSGNPILGNEYAIMTTVYSLENGTVDRIGVLTESGLLYPKLLELLNDSSTVNSVYLLKLKLNTSVSMIVMEGRDSRGFEFRRARNINLEPVMVELSVVHFTEEKRYDEPFNVTYTIANKGNSPIQLTTTINVTNGNLPDGRPSVHVNLSPFDNFTSNFLVRGQMSSPFLKYSIAVMTNGDSKVLQRSEQTVVITTKKHPEFVQINKSSDCPLSALNTGNCSLYLWKTESILRLSGVNVTNITLSSAASLSYVSNDSTIVMAVQGDCCVPSTEIQVFDSDFYSVVKSVDFSGGYAVQSIPSKIADQEVKESIALPLLIGGIVGGLVLLCVLIVIIVRRNNKS